MTKLTFNELLNDYRHLLDDGTYVKVFEFYIRRGKDAEKLQNLLFKEEGDWYYDSSSESQERAMGKNPMRAEYTERMNKKRIALGVSPLTENGYNPDNTSKEFCEAIIRNSPAHKETHQSK